jgi:hypothetical protein
MRTGMRGIAAKIAPLPICRSLSREFVRRQLAIIIIRFAGHESACTLLQVCDHRTLSKSERRRAVSGGFSGSQGARFSSIRPLAAALVASQTFF